MCTICADMAAGFRSSDFISESLTRDRGIAMNSAVSFDRPLSWLDANQRGGGVEPVTGKTSFSVAQAAAHITRESGGWSTSLGTPVTVTYGFRSNEPPASYNANQGPPVGFNRFNETQIQATELMLAAWSDVAGISFLRVGAGTSGEGAFTDNATMLLANYSDTADGSAGYAYYPGGTAASSPGGDVWLNAFDYNINPQYLAYGYLTIVHEIGHAIGLAHPGAYNAAPGLNLEYAANAEYYEDSRQYSVMSYFEAASTGANHIQGGLEQYAAAPLLDDIAAAQRLYGANMTTRTGDTVYGFNATAGRLWYDATAGGAAQNVIFAVWDAGGLDTLDFSGYAQNGLIDLRQGHFSSVGALTGNVAIAMGAVIENAIGGAGADTLIGNDADNRLRGNGGADAITGGLGSDTAVFSGNRSAYTISNIGAVFTVTGTDGTDTLTGVEFAQFADQILALTISNDINGTAAGETINGTAAADVINALGGADTVFANGGSDTVNGGDGNDTLVGNGDVFAQENDTLNGEAGDDLIYAEFTDVLNGGEGRDSLIAVNSFNFNLNMAATSIEYAVMDFGNDTVDASAQSVRVDVFASGGNDGVTGSNFDDLLFGGSGNDSIIGGLGADALVGEAGIDSLSGGDGDDRIYFDAQDSFVSGGVGYDAGYITLGTGAGVTVDMGAASLEFIQDLAGANDTILGSSATTGLIAFTGGGGDTIDGSGFNDILWGEAGDDSLSGNAGNDVMVGGLGTDTLRGGAGNDSLYGGAGDGVRDTFVFLETGAGNADAVYDFTLGSDKIDLSAFGASFAGVSITNAGGSSIVFLNGQQVCTVVGVTGLTASDFVFTPGGGPADPGDGWTKGAALVQPSVLDDVLDAPLIQPGITDDVMSSGAFGLLSPSTVEIDFGNMDLALRSGDRGFGRTVVSDYDWIV